MSFEESRYKLIENIHNSLNEFKEETGFYPECDIDFIFGVGGLAVKPRVTVIKYLRAIE